SFTLTICTWWCLNGNIKNPCARYRGTGHRDCVCGLVLPEVVLSRSLARVDQRMLNELHHAVGDLNLQCLGVQRLVVVRAQGDAVLYTCFTLIRPEVDMVHFAPSSGPVASRHSTPSIPGQDGS